MPLKGGILFSAYRVQRQNKELKHRFPEVVFPCSSLLDAEILNCSRHWKATGRVLKKHLYKHLYGNLEMTGRDL